MALPDALPQAAGKPHPSDSALCKTTSIDPTYDCTLDSRCEKGKPAKIQAASLHGEKWRLPNFKRKLNILKSSLFGNDFIYIY